MRSTLLSLVALALAVVALVPEGARAFQVTEPRVVRVAPLMPSAVAVADSLLYAMEPLGAARRLEARLEIEPDDFESRWRAARVEVALGIMAGPGDREAWLRAAARHAEIALTQRPDDPRALAWAAAAKGRIATDVAGYREKASLAQEVLALTTRLLQIEPDHALGHGVLGKLHQEIRRFSAFERLIARTLLGGGELVRIASWEGAETHLRRAIELDPDFVLFYLDLGETYMLQDKDEDARRTFEAGLRPTERFPTDSLFKSTIRTRLAELAGGLAP